MDQYLGTIMLFASDFAPEYWALCNGQVLNITQNQALFSVIGATYGGDGRTTFALPDLRGFVPVGYGAAAGSGRIVAALGQKGGATTTTLTSLNLPTHTHTFAGQPQGTNLSTAASSATYTIPAISGTNATIDDPTTSTYLSKSNVGGGDRADIYATGTPNKQMPGGTIAIPSVAVTGTIGTISGVTAVAGSGQPASIIPPYLALNYIICINGIYPSRNY